MIQDKWSAFYWVIMVTFILVLVVTLSVGLHTRSHFEQKAIEAGVAEYVLDENDERVMVWKLCEKELEE